MQKIGHSPHQLRHIERGELEFLAARECQHPLRQCRAALRALKRVIEQADKMPQAVARYFVGLKLSAEDIDRVNLLSAKAREGSLEDEENEECSRAENEQPAAASA